MLKNVNLSIRSTVQINDLDESGNITMQGCYMGWKKYIILLETTAIWMPNVLNVNSFQMNKEGQNWKIRLTSKHYSMLLT